MSNLASDGFGDWWAGSRGFAVVLLLPIVIWISIVDFRRLEIPDSATVLVGAIGALFWEGKYAELAINIVVAGVMVLVIGAIGNKLWQRTGREWLGLGDAKLIGAATIVVGWDALWIVLLLASSGGLASTFIASDRSETKGVPFGPFLAYAILVTHLIAGPSR
jgi:prepilin signal peptidase PulO-like enzyme (type II secretory pathway)